MLAKFTIRHLLPPAYEIRREGNSFTLFVSPHLGGYPYPIMLCNISQNAMGQPPGRGVPCQVQPGGVVPCQVQPRGVVPCQGGYPAGGYPARGVPCWGVPCQGVYPARGGTLLVGYPARGVPCQGEGAPCWGWYPARGYPGQIPPRPGQDGEGTMPGGTQVRYPPAGYPPSQVRTGGYPVRTT